MTWTRDEAEQAAWEEEHGYIVDLLCPSCETTWRSRVYDGELTKPQCPNCGEAGEEQ